MQSPIQIDVQRFNWTSYTNADNKRASVNIVHKKQFTSLFCYFFLVHFHHTFDVDHFTKLHSWWYGMYLDVPATECWKILMKTEENNNNETHKNDCAPK